MVRWAGILIWVITVVSRASGPGDDPAVAGVREFTAAYQAWDGARFKAAADLFRQACTNAPNSCTNFYWLGTTEFHRALELQNRPGPPTNSAAADQALDAAADALVTAVKLDPGHAESHALLGTIYGMKINGNLFRAARFGPRVARHEKLALVSDADNPRVRYLLGTCQFHTARGNAALREALATFLLAEKLYAAEAQQPAGPLDPRWGRSSCLTFLGRTYEMLGQRAEAADCFHRALAQHPADHVAKAGLDRLAQAN